MLDAAPSLNVVRDLTVTVARTLPSTWPSAMDPGSAHLHLFQSREFLRSWLATRGQSRRVRTYFVDVRWRDGAPFMMLPLSITRFAGSRILEFIDGGLADYCGPVLFDSEVEWSRDVAEAVWERVLAELPPVDIVRLNNLTEQIDGRTNPLALLTETLNESGGGHAIDLTRSLADIESQQHMLKSMKQSLKQLEKIGPVALRIAQTEDEVDRYLAKALEQKQRRFEDTQVNGFELDPDKLAYFKLATRQFRDAGKLYLCVLTVGEEIVATSWCLALGGTVCAIMIGFEMGPWRKYSCGRILNHLQTRHFKENGFTLFDQGIGDESWKMQVCDQHFALRQYHRVLRPRAQLALTYWGLKARLRTNPHARALKAKIDALRRRRRAA